MKNTIIAIDGFSSCGKSTLAKALAKHLNFIHIDSGAMYRAATLHFLINRIDITNEAEIQRGLKSLSIKFKRDSCDMEASSYILLNGDDVSSEIRKFYISEHVSHISAIKEVREALVRQQQEMANDQNIIMDGRDIGTTVFPHAQIKLFMTADPGKRAERRFNELKAKGNAELTLEDVFTSIAQRDYNDTTREISPLICAHDAIILDNTLLSEAEQVEVALKIIQPFVLTRES